MGSAVVRSFHLHGKVLSTMSLLPPCAIRYRLAHIGGRHRLCAATTLAQRAGDTTGDRRIAAAASVRHQSGGGVRRGGYPMRITSMVLHAAGRRPVGKSWA